jgi:ubiquitin-protein ligase
MSIRRLNKELSSVAGDDTLQFIELINDNITHQRWSIGVEFEDGIIKVNITVTVPSDYPFKSPNVLTEKAVFHPNILDCKMCLNTINNWHPKTTIKEILTEVKQLLINPNLDTALFTEAANVLKKDKKQYLRLYKNSLK